MKPKSPSIEYGSPEYYQAFLAPKQHKSFAQREMDKHKLAPKPQKPCDHGLFSDEANQLDLVEMLQDPSND